MISSDGYLYTFSWSLPGLSWMAFALFLVGMTKMLSFFVFPSVRNVPFVLSIPFVAIAVGWGAFYWTAQYISAKGLNQGTAESFLTILAIGSAVTCLSAVATIRGLTAPRGYAVFNGLLVDDVNRGAGLLLSIAAMLMLAGAAAFIGGFYLLTGIVPAFAENPLVAKYFAGEYTARAAPYMPLFRGGMVLYQVGTLVGILLLPARVNVGRIMLFLLLGLLGCAAVLALLSLRRGVAAQPIVEGLLILLVMRGRLGWVIAGVAAYLLIFTFGSAVNQILLLMLGLRTEVGLDAIIKGLSDIYDLWWFMDAYNKAGPDPTMGMTVFGGLVPYDFQWNPSNYTKWIIGADLNTGSGGFRLPMSVWGYDAFRYPGLVLWSAVDGFTVVVQAFLFRLVVEKGGSRYVLAINIITYKIVFLISSNLLQWKIDDVFLIIVFLTLRLAPAMTRLLGQRQANRIVPRTG
ncbi:hypothetical protein QFZ27_002677 [Inquilinus ginsengisoli]|uniref:hypothetical protein n=1 Tax=Inquilinus ginsengisoli TaxID=363840 RepID=UPI003D1B6EE8